MDILLTSQAIPLVRRPRTLLAGACAVIVIAVLGTLMLGDAMPRVARNSLWMDIAKLGDMVRVVRASGTLVPRNTRWISAGTLATVQRLMVPTGSQVNADTTIIQLSNPATEANLAKARASLAGARANLVAKRTELVSQELDHAHALAIAESNFALAKVRNKALQEAWSQGAVSRIDLEQSQVTTEQDAQLVDVEKQRVEAFKEQVSAQIQASQASCDEAQSELSIAQEAADSLNVRAGIDGILQDVSVEPGQQVVAGANLARVAQQDQLMARLNVPEVQAKDVSVGQVVNIDTHNGIVAGTLSRIDPAVHEGTVAVDVTLTQSLPSGARPDQSVDGLITLNTLHDVVSIARPALASPYGQSSLFVLSAGSKVAHRVKVTYGASSSDRIEVTDGLKPDDEVVLSDTSQWDKYSSLRIN